MKTFQKFALLCLIILFVIVLAFGQQKKSQAIVEKENKVKTTKDTKPKVFSPDNTLISKNITQKRNITQYLDGGAIRCGTVLPKECNENKLNDFIWQCWTEKTRGYITISYSFIDKFSEEHIFIEPNRKKQWQVVRRFESEGSITDLITAFSVRQIKNKKNKLRLVFKDKFGKTINDF